MEIVEVRFNGPADDKLEDVGKQVKGWAVFVAGKREEKEEEKGLT